MEITGVSTIEEILSIAKDEFQITIFGAEPHPNYNRILLSKVLQGDTDIKDITLNDWDWYEENNIQLYTNETVIKVDTENKTVITDADRIQPYDELILATGSVPFILPIPGADKKGVTAFRDIKDTDTMLAASKQYKKAAVIGGGLLGLEAARGLLNLGMDVSVIHLAPFLMERQLDATAGRLLQNELEKQGMTFLLEKQTEEIVGDDRVEGLRFKDGTSIEADLVVMAVGIRPNTTLVPRAAFRLTAASSSTIICRLKSRTFTRSANVPSTEESPTGLWRRCMNRQKCWQSICAASKQNRMRAPFSPHS